MTLLDEVDRLYERSVMEPASVGERTLEDWANDVSTGYAVDRAGAKFVRRCLTVARKLATFWLEHDRASNDATDWRQRVDVALGIRAWRPQLDLARYLLAESPSPEVFEHVARLFRLVNSEEFLEGVTYEEWLDTRHN